MSEQDRQNPILSPIQIKDKGKLTPVPDRVLRVIAESTNCRSAILVMFGQTEEDGTHMVEMAHIGDNVKDTYKRTINVLSVVLNNDNK